MASSPSPTGWNATFKPWRTEPVVGWDELGYALIVEPSSGKRITAHYLEGHEFCGLERADRPFVGVLPANGEILDWGDGSDDRILAFGIQSDGVLRPILDSHRGHGEPYFPDEASRSAQIRRGPRL